MAEDREVLANCRAYIVVIYNTDFPHRLTKSWCRLKNFQSDAFILDLSSQLEMIVDRNRVDNIMFIKT